MLKVLLMGLIAQFFMSLYGVGKLLYYLVMGKACTVTIGEIQKKEIPCYYDEKKVRYFYNAEVDLNGEKFQTTYEEVMDPKDAKEVPAGTVKAMRYRRSSDTLYDWEGAKTFAIASAISFGLTFLLIFVLSLFL